MANDVRIEKLDGAWTVLVVEGGQTSQRTFETKRFANNYAAGQRMRLGLLTKSKLEGDQISGNEM